MDDDDLFEEENEIDFLEIEIGAGLDVVRDRNAGGFTIIDSQLSEESTDDVPVEIKSNNDAFVAQWLNILFRTELKALGY